MTTPMLQRINTTDITLHKPIPYSVYDEHGKLLLRPGTAITIPRYLDMLLARGAYFDSIEIQQAQQAAAAKKKPAEQQPVFVQVEGLLLNLKHVYTTFVQDPGRVDLAKRIQALAQQLQQACEKDADAALAALHLDQSAPYRVHHQLLCATIVELTMREMSIDADERLPLVCAALTHDIGLIEAGDALESAKPPLPAELKVTLQAHPERAAGILESGGVSDPLWLEAVRNHHERLDGSGYPKGKSADEIGLGGRLLAIADIYGALIRSRPQRSNAMFPQNALREIYLDNARLDVKLIQLTIKAIGMMPPGSIVRLQCNEIAVVRSRANGATAARIFSVYTPAGMPILNPAERDIKNPIYAVSGKVNYDECRSAEVIMRRLWTT
ncbi:MAG: HD domain-containing phosphohydrolase [Rhodocyclaceae bacterium]